VRVGLSWDLGGDAGAVETWPGVLAEIAQADAMGFESVWVQEGREAADACSSPALFLTWVARKTKSLQLRVAGRGVTRGDAVRTAEELAVLDNFARGRAGLAFASATRQQAEPALVHETVEMVSAAWSMDEFRYRGDHVRFPSHTGDDAPRGASELPPSKEYVPQWEWGPIMPDFLAITPKPYSTRPPLYVEIEDDATLEWAARAGIAPFVPAEVPTGRAVERLVRYREVADAAGRRRDEVDATLERRLVLDGEDDACALGGSSEALVIAIREIRGRTGISHVVWRRGTAAGADLYRFASEVQPMLQS